MLQIPKEQHGRCLSPKQGSRTSEVHTRKPTISMFTGFVPWKHLGGSSHPTNSSGSGAPNLCSARGSTCNKVRPNELSGETTYQETYVTGVQLPSQVSITSSSHRHRMLSLCILHSQRSLATCTLTFAIVGFWCASVDQTSSVLKAPRCQEQTEILKKIANSSMCSSVHGH